MSCFSCLSSQDKKAARSSGSSRRSRSLPPASTPRKKESSNAGPLSFTKFEKFLDKPPHRGFKSYLSGSHLFLLNSW